MATVWCCLCAVLWGVVHERVRVCIADDGVCVHVWEDGALCLCKFKHSRTCDALIGALFEFCMKSVMSHARTAAHGRKHLGGT